jgi:hypothetical protein
VCLLVCVCVCVRVCVFPTLGVFLFSRGLLGPWATGPDPAIDSPNVMLFVWILALRL